MKHYFLQVVDPSNGNWVAQMAGIALAACMSFIAPVKGFLFLTGACVMADMYMGYRKSRKLDPTVRFNAAGLGKTLDKSLVYLILILISRGVDNEFKLDGLTSLGYVICGLIIVREVISIFENADVILGADFTSRVTSIFHFLKKKTPKDK